MAWNEPGGNNQDPWGGRKKNDGPPDLDEALKKFQNKVQDLFGKKDGKYLKIKLWTEHPPMSEWGGKAAYYKNIAIPLSIGAQMIARGDISLRGVVPPELAIDPEMFFDELKMRGIEVFEETEWL